MSGEGYALASQIAGEKREKARAYLITLTEEAFTENLGVYLRSHTLAEKRAALTELRVTLRLAAEEAHRLMRLEELIAGKQPEGEGRL